MSVIHPGGVPQNYGVDIHLLDMIRRNPPKNPAYLFPPWFFSGCEEAEIIPGIWVPVLPEPRLPYMQEWTGVVADEIAPSLTPQQIEFLRRRQNQVVLRSGITFTDRRD